MRPCAIARGIFLSWDCPKSRAQQRKDSVQVTHQAGGLGSTGARSLFKRPFFDLPDPLARKLHIGANLRQGLRLAIAQTEPSFNDGAFLIVKLMQQTGELFVERPRNQ